MLAYFAPLAVPAIIALSTVGGYFATRNLRPERTETNR